jgi:uncharacterized membrane protein YphA (DoxX/SURF4 family)
MVGNLALLILRAIVGSLMLGHGAQKLFGWWGEYRPGRHQRLA